MSHSHNSVRALLAAVTITAVAACAAPQTSPRTTSAPSSPSASSAAAAGPSTMNPELAGAWYQVFFATNSTDINERGRMIVQRVAYVTANEPTTRVTLIGKSDQVGAPSPNLILSQRRADAVRAALVAAGVPTNRISTSWTGEGRPDVVASTADGAEQLNRVVDITIMKWPR